MPDTIDFLKTRRSVKPREMSEPGPSPAELETILTIGARVPDHGKLTDVTVSHRAAVITLKLVSDRGGEALANTAWSVITPGGDVIKESIGAFPRVVLSEGEYRAIAKNEGKVFERSFNVVNGVDTEVEVVAR